MKVNWWIVGGAALIIIAMSGRRLSPAGLDFLIKREGLRLKPYNDSAGHCTIGIGHLLHKGKCNGSEPSMTREEVIALFESDVQKFIDGITRLVKVPLAQHELDALTSFVFNIGLGAFKGSTLLKKLNAGDRASVPSEMLKWTKQTDPKTGELVVSKSAINRRTIEGNIFANGIYA